MNGVMFAADVNEPALAIFGIVVAATLAITYWASKRMTGRSSSTLPVAVSARAAAALGMLSVAGFYLIAQMVGAGVLIQALVGIDFEVSVLLTGAFMLTYVVFGGMLATTWVQIIKAVLLMSATILMSILVLETVGFDPIELFNRARDESPEGDAYLAPGLFLKSPIDTLSLGIALVLGTAGLPHILMRFFTVPDAKAARSSRRELIARGGLRRPHRGGLDRRARDHHRNPGRSRPERLVHGRAGVRGRRERELPGPAARAHLATIQYDWRGDRRAARHAQLDSARDHQPDRVAWPHAEGGAFGFYDLANPGIISVPLGSGERHVTISGAPAARAAAPRLRPPLHCRR